MPRYALPRCIEIWLLSLLMVAGGVLAADDPESRLSEVERLVYSAPWAVSSARIKTLEADRARLSPSQKWRLDYLRLRQFAIAGEEVSAVDGLRALLDEDLPPRLRISVYITAMNVAAHIEDWTLAFTWLNEALSYVPAVPEEFPRLLEAASYLYTSVDEVNRARTLAMRGLDLARDAHSPDALVICRLTADVALAEEKAGNTQLAEAWRHRQIEACERAGDAIFVANGKYGVGKMIAARGQHAEALTWAQESLAEFDSAGFVAGAYGSRLLIAEVLIAVGRDLDQAAALLGDALEYFRRVRSDFSIADTQSLLARLMELRGDLASALVHQKAAAAANGAAERNARERQLTYLQVQFDTQSREQQIALLETGKQLAEARETANQRRQLVLVLGLGGALVTAMLLLILLHRSARERRRYRWQSEHDGLTGLYNYQQVRRLGEAAFARARGSGGAFTALVIDVDLFKQVNDRYGHAAGDTTLRMLADWISEALDGRGIAGRSGGDEFTVLLDADAQAAEAVAQRLHDRNEPITVFGRTFRVGISAGVCQADEHTQSLEQLIHEADQALYRAKHEGRGRVMRVRDPASPPAAAAGLVVVGGGIQFGRHASERCLSEIRAAEVVLCLADPFALGMISAMRPDVINLGLHYAPGKDRRQTYREIDAAIMQEVRAGKQVCAVFYGHPGVFADVPHRVIRKARAEGCPARMEPGISAEACLYADLGLDPGHRGVQSIEATHFLHYDRQLDPLGLVLLWQVALSGDLSCTRLHAEREGLQALVDKLLRFYPPGHEVILYEAAQLPIDVPRMDRLALGDLPSAHYREYTTLVIPPLGELCVDPASRLETRASLA